MSRSLFWGAVPPGDVTRAVLERHGLDFRITPQPAPYGVGAHFSPVADFALESAPPRVCDTPNGPVATRDIVLAFVLCGKSAAYGARRDGLLKQPPRVPQPSPLVPIAPGILGVDTYDSVSVLCARTCVSQCPLARNAPFSMIPHELPPRHPLPTPCLCPRAPTASCPSFLYSVCSCFSGRTMRTCHVWCAGLGGSAWARMPCACRVRTVHGIPGVCRHGAGVSRASVVDHRACGISCIHVFV